MPPPAQANKYEGMALYMKNLSQIARDSGVAIMLHSQLPKPFGENQPACPICAMYSPRPTEAIMLAFKNRFSPMVTHVRISKAAFDRLAKLPKLIHRRTIRIKRRNHAK